MELMTKICINNCILDKLRKVFKANNIEMQKPKSFTKSLNEIRLVPMKSTSIPTVVLKAKTNHYNVHLEWPEKESVASPVLSIKSVEDAKMFTQWYDALIALAPRRKTNN